MSNISLNLQLHAWLSYASFWNCDVMHVSYFNEHLYIQHFRNTKQLLVIDIFNRGVWIILQSHLDNLSTS